MVRQRVPGATGTIPTTLTSGTHSHASSLLPATSPTAPTSTLFTTTVRLPNRSTTVCTADSTWRVR